MIELSGSACLYPPVLGYKRTQPCLSWWLHEHWELKLRSSCLQSHSSVCNLNIFYCSLIFKTPYKIPKSCQSSNLSFSMADACAHGPLGPPSTSFASRKGAETLSCRGNFTFSIQAINILLNGKHARSKYLLGDECLINVKQWKPYVLVIPLGKQKLGKCRCWSWVYSKSRGWLKGSSLPLAPSNHSAHNTKPEEHLCFVFHSSLVPVPVGGGKRWRVNLFSWRVFKAAPPLCTSPSPHHSAGVEPCSPSLFLPLQIPSFPPT